MSDNRTELLIIDPQVDFCDPSGALYVVGAEHDMSRIATFVDKFGHKLNDINVTLDSHHLMDVAHPNFWINTKGEHPAPFTLIKADEVKAGDWLPSVPSCTQRMVKYVEALEAKGKYPLCIWPEHCLIGSPGHAVLPVLLESLLKWTKDQKSTINWVSKGSNIFTEHYSAIKAEVPDPADPSTQVNTRLIQKLKDGADRIIIMGEAGSHCVANTARDIVEEFQDPDAVKKLVLFLDCMSPVTGGMDFTPMQDEFIKDMVALGVQTTTSTDFVY